MAKVSDKVLSASKNSRVSNMVKAMQGWETSFASASQTPTGQFGHKVKVQTNGLTLTNELDMAFDVPFDDNTEANEASITFYNLTKKSIGYLKPNKEISITAGYGSDTGVIFTGVISTVKTRWSGQDKVTTITAIDCEDLKERDIESISFNAGVQASYILKTLVSKLGLPIAVFKVRRDHTYTDSVTVSGGLMGSIEQYAEVCGVSAYINKRKVYVQHLSQGEALGFTVSVDTGLIDSPEEFTEEVKNEDYTDTIEGVSFKMLLEHRITTASIINLKSRDFSGTYRVRSGRHVYNESDFTTEVTAISNVAPVGASAPKSAGGSTAKGKAGVGKDQIAHE